MKSVIRSTFIYSLSLFFLAQLLSGVIIKGGLTTYIIGGFALSIMSFVIKPILNIVSLPLNIVTLGTFSAITSALILYLLTLFVPAIVIKEFTFEGFKYAGFAIPSMSFNTIFAYIVASCVLSLIVAFLKWIKV